MKRSGVSELWSRVEFVNFNKFHVRSVNGYQGVSWCLTWGRGPRNGEDPDLAGAMAAARESEPVVEQLQQVQQTEPADELPPSTSRSLDFPQDRRMHMLSIRVYRFHIGFALFGGNSF